MLDLDKLGAVRLVNAESDGLPGIVVERYGDYLVVQLFTAAVAGLRDDLYDALEAELAPEGDLRAAPLSSRSAARRRARPPPSWCAATAAPVELEVKEDDLTFVVDVTAPLSTGLFADLREGRRAVRQWATGPARAEPVLVHRRDLGLRAGRRRHRGRARSTSPRRRTRARAATSRRRASIPRSPSTSSATRSRSSRGSSSASRTFDMVVLDPPAFASAAARGGKAWSAMRDYAELVTASLDVARAGRPADRRIVDAQDVARSSSSSRSPTAR